MRCVDLRRVKQAMLGLLEQVAGLHLSLAVTAKQALTYRELSNCFQAFERLDFVALDASLGPPSPRRARED